MSSDGLPADNRHPWLDGRFPDAGRLSDSERIWTFVAAHAAKGDLEAVKHDWSFLPDEAHAGGIEIILQTHLFAGYPRTINALAAVRKVGVAPPAASAPLEKPESTWAVDGEALCRTVYGESYDPLRQRISTLHPVLDRWMVQTGYGRVLSRGDPAPRVRWLCVLAVLAGQDVKPQLRSHIQGAVHVGATASECHAILQQTEAVWGAEAQKQVDRVWSRLAPSLE